MQLSLMFDAVDEADLANYTCYVENHIGRRSGSAILQKKGKFFFPVYLIVVDNKKVLQVDIKTSYHATFSCHKCHVNINCLYSNINWAK